MSRMHKRPLACVMGSMDLVRAIGLAGVRCAVVARPGSPTLYSRFTETALPWADFSASTDDLVDALMGFGETQAEPPVLYFETDAQLLLVSRHRRRLAQAFRFALADAQLVEDLVDKSRFLELAERLDLPVPATRRLRPSVEAAAPDLDLRFPVIVKPHRRDKAWQEAGKALRVDSQAELRALWPQLAAGRQDLLVQEMIPGPETGIESYHVYVDERGSIAGEFTGRKIRTYPTVYGHTTSLEITDEADVAALGRSLTDRLGLQGVAKFDFKRAPDGRLHLLEVNPRFNLWHHPGAVAGVNLPGLIYGDLAGLPRPAAMPRAKAGIRWVHLLNDRLAARESGIPMSAWLPWALGCEAKVAVSWDDPMPLLLGLWHRRFSTPNDSGHAVPGKA